MDKECSGNEERKESSMVADNSILETIMAQKMASAALAPNNNMHVFMRSNSVDSVCSAHSYSSLMSGDDRCRCDDCILGITDIMADVGETTRLQAIPDNAVGKEDKVTKRKVKRKIKCLWKNLNQSKTKLVQILKL